MNIAVITTFPNSSWEIYAKKMLTGFISYWPNEIPLMIELDDNLLETDIQKIIRPQDAIAGGWTKEHKEFVERNKSKDDPENYRKQGVRFCHKVFAIHRALIAAQQQKEHGEGYPRYLIWLDADVITNRPVTMDDIKECLPKDGDAVSYMGRRDWDHSECGWLAFDLENGGDKVINGVIDSYINDSIFNATQWHDSWIWDTMFLKITPSTNLTPEAKGMDVWPQSPMGKWSTHYKGPEAKAKLINQPIQQSMPIGNRGNVVIQTRNALPNEELKAHIADNQNLIKHWIKPCKPNDEEIVIVSAGPMMTPEDLRLEVAAGRRIVAVKHAIEPLRKTGITPWACILLDPRPHVNDFIQNPDTNIIWLVASQVDPIVTRTLLDAGCTIWGYHAAVGAEETDLTDKQLYSVISGGTATATRGIHVLNHLGFSKFRLYGYDLCLYDKPNMSERDERGQPKYMEISIGFNDKNVNQKKCYWTKPELIAQFEEINELIKQEKFKIEAFGDGIVSFIIRSKKLANLRNGEFVDKMIGKQMHYEELLGCRKTWLARLRRWLRKTRLKLRKASRSYSY